MKKKITVFILCAMLFALCLPVKAQQAKKIPQIGVLYAGLPGVSAPQVDGFRQGLRDLAMLQGKDVFRHQYRFAAGKLERLPLTSRPSWFDSRLTSSWPREVRRRS